MKIRNKFSSVLKLFPITFTKVFSLNKYLKSKKIRTRTRKKNVTPKSTRRMEAKYTDEALVPARIQTSLLHRSDLPVSGRQHPGSQSLADQLLLDDGQGCQRQQQSGGVRHRSGPRFQHQNRQQVPPVVLHRIRPADRLHRAGRDQGVRVQTARTLHESGSTQVRKVDSDVGTIESSVTKPRSASTNCKSKEAKACSEEGETFKQDSSKCEPRSSQQSSSRSTEHSTDF